MLWSDLPADVLAALKRGTVIPAHPLALDAGRNFDARRQNALTRYYLDAGSGGLAVGVHATQFAIRDRGLYEPVLAQAAETARTWNRLDATRPVVLVAGLSGKTAQAKTEAEVARGLGYHAAMLSLAPMKGASVDELIAHCSAVAEVMPDFAIIFEINFTPSRISSRENEFGMSLSKTSLAASFTQPVNFPSDVFSNSPPLGLGVDSSTIAILNASELQ